MPMFADREHLYGRDVIPLAFLAQVTRRPVGDRGLRTLALARRLGGTSSIRRPTASPSSGEPVRAEARRSHYGYLFPQSGGPAQPPGRTPDAEGVVRAGRWGRGLGTGPGLVAHQRAGPGPAP